jgi:hypothetical protein
VVNIGLEESQWMEDVKQEVPLSIAFTHTTREAWLVLDHVDSSLAVEKDKVDRKLLAMGKTSEDTQVPIFDGKELFWSNKMRSKYIKDGLHRRVPQVLYLVRPETAFIGCLHFLAKELGGCDRYMEQRRFIMQNTGLIKLMKKFWTRVQEVAWSGGFSPSISDEERALIILALTECYSYTSQSANRRGENAILVPHLEAETLNAVGIWFPSLQDNGAALTDDSINKLKEQQQRKNLPGIPSDNSAYLHCVVCNSTMDTVADMKIHRETSECCGQAKCEGCGLSFPTANDYQIHAITFCRQGPLQQSRCPCCSQPGPSCLCQVHWARTYRMASELWQGTQERAKWIGDRPEMASLLIMAAVHLNEPLLEESGTLSQAPTPRPLNISLWEEVKLPLSKHEGERLSLCQPDGKFYPLDHLEDHIEDTLNIQLKTLGKPLVEGKQAPGSLKKNENKKQIHKSKYLGTSGIKGDHHATYEELDLISEKISNTETQLKTGGQKKKLFLLTLGKTEDEVMHELGELKALQASIAISLTQQEDSKDPEKIDRREHIKFRNSPSPEGRASPRGRTDRKNGGRRSSSRSPGMRTTTSMRGSSKTHTLYLTLQRAMSVLSCSSVNPRSTAYKRKYKDLRDSMADAEKHLRFDEAKEVDNAWEEYLEEAINSAEDQLDQIDSKSDEIDSTAKEKERMAKCLPKASPQKWDGLVNDYTRFRSQALTLIDVLPDKRMAQNAILEMISDYKLRKRLSKHSSPEKLLSDLELEYGNPELSGPKIVNDMKGLPRCAGPDSESSTILKMKEHWVSLGEIKQEHLLGRNELYSLCHKLSDREGMRIQKELHSVRDLDQLRKTFFEELDELYTKNTIWSRTDLDKKPSREYKNPVSKEPYPRNSTQRKHTSTNHINPGHCCLCQGEGHPPWMCSKAADLDLGQLKKLNIHLCCFKYNQKDERDHGCKAGRLKCTQCGFNLAFVKLHENCKESGPPGTEQPHVVRLPGSVVDSVYTPALPAQEEKPKGSKNCRIQVGVRDYAWRSEGGPLANPNPLNTALELVDHAVIQSPDGQYKKVRILHDQYGADSSLADVNLASYSHRTGRMAFQLHTANGSQKVETDEMVLKIILPDGRPRFIKTIATEMRSQNAFTIVKKWIDAPPHWNNQHFNQQAHFAPNGNLRFLNLTDGEEVDILLGSDNSYLAPMEMDRYEDDAGCVTLYKSCLQENILLLGGGRLVGGAVVPIMGSQHRGFQLTAEEDFDNCTVRRITADDTVLFPENPIAKMSKLDQKFFKEFEDNNLLPPHPRACNGCAECPTCSDVGAVMKRKAIEARLDDICQLDSINPWPEGGWHISLLWNNLKPKVPENRQDSVRRFLATERALLKSPEALQTFNEQVNKCLSLGYFVLSSDYKGNLDGLQISYLPLSYALKDTVEEAGEPLLGAEPANLAGKTKARPVSDGSHRANMHTPSVNESLVPIPDLWTGKIQNLLLKFRTARRLAMADISQYFHRLRLDPDSVSMTRAIWRAGGIGGQGELTTMLVPSASMGLTPVPALASHCRARTADLVEDQVARQSLKESYCDDVYLPTLWEQPGGKKIKHRLPPEPDSLLIDRIKQTESALGKAKLQLGEAGWVTDLDWKILPHDTKGVTGVTSSLTTRDIGASTTGALGLRWSIGSMLPDGGIFSYRVHRPGSLNLLPKKRGKRPPEGELRSRDDIRKFLQTKGLTKAGLLGLVMNLFDVLQLALPWISTAKQLYREILKENPELGWKQQVPEYYHKRIEDLATDLLRLSTGQSFPRKAIQEGPDGTIGHLTLIIAHDASAESACALAYVHQQWPIESVRMPSTVTNQHCSMNESNITTRVRLLCGAHKLTTTGHEEQVAGELLSATVAVKLRKIIVEQSLINFDKVIYLGDSLTVAKVIRKSNRAFNSWAATRVSFIQREEDTDNMFHVPGKFLVPTADKGTRSQVNPSELMDEAYWEGVGTINTPLHMLPITPPSQYTTPGLDELPDGWLHKAAVRLKPVLLSARITCHHVDMISTELQTLSGKYRSFDKLKRILMLILKMSPAFRGLSADQIWKASEERLLRMDYYLIKLSLKGKRIAKTFLLSDNKKDRLLHVIGRDGYKTPLIANPKVSKIARTILKQYHDKNHLSSPATINALVFKDFYFVGGSVAYLKKLELKCPRCKLLRARPSEALAGEPPEGTQGPLLMDKSIWRRWMLDICGPLMLVPWAGKRTLRGTRITLKHWILLSVDLCSRQIDAVLLEGYSANSVLTGLRELTGRHGVPQHIYWDRASNLRAAAALFRDEVEDDSDVSLSQKIKIQEELKRSFEANGVTVHLSIPYSSHRQGRVEAGVKRLKTQLTELCYNASQTKLTPMEVTSLLSAACSALNSRPLLLTAECSLEEKRILCPSYLTCADLNLQNTSCALDPKTQHWFNIHDSPLTRRAAMVQERIETFKYNFGIFMIKSFASLGKFNREFNRIGEGDVVLILDKKKDTLPVQSKNRYVLGVVEEVITDRSFRIRYIIPGRTCGKCSKMLCQHNAGRTVDQCERSIQGLSLIVKADEASMVAKKDVVIDPLFPPGRLVELVKSPNRTITLPPEGKNESRHETVRQPLQLKFISDDEQVMIKDSKDARLRVKVNDDSAPEDILNSETAKNPLGLKFISDDGQVMMKDNETVKSPLGLKFISDDGQVMMKDNETVKSPLGLKFISDNTQEMMKDISSKD